MHTKIAKLFKAIDLMFFALSQKCFDKKDALKRKAIENKSNKLVQIANARDEVDKAHDEALEAVTKELARDKSDQHRRLSDKRNVTLDEIAALEVL